MHKKKCQAMSKSVTFRAKAMDPHQSLEEVFKAKLKENRSVSSLCQRVPVLGSSRSWALKNGKMELLDSYNRTQSRILLGTVRNLQWPWELLCIIGVKAILDWKKRIDSKNLVNSRNNDRKRAKEYKKELEEMKKRIQTRPYLFEQVSKVKLNHHSFSFSFGWKGSWKWWNSFVCLFF